jgi:hypothetical protein
VLSDMIVLASSNAGTQLKEHGSQGLQERSRQSGWDPGGGKGLLRLPISPIFHLRTMRPAPDSPPTSK